MELRKILKASRPLTCSSLTMLLDADKPSAEEICTGVKKPPPVPVNFYGTIANESAATLCTRLSLDHLQKRLSVPFLLCYRSKSRWRGLCWYQLIGGGAGDKGSKAGLDSNYYYASHLENQTDVISTQAPTKIDPADAAAAGASAE